MKDRPNILLLMSDQHNANCLGVNGNSVVRTPNLDALATRGVNFARAYCNNPICGPSRLCLHSGQYVHTHGHFGNSLFEYPERNPNTLGAQLRRYGYQTALIGKGHMIGQWNEEAFEHIRYCDLCDARHTDPTTCHYFAYLVENGLAELYEDGSPGPELAHTLDGSGPARLPYEHSLEHWTGNETLAFLESRDRRRPFFCDMSFERPHAPIAPAKEHWDRYDPDDIILPDSAIDYLERDFAGKPQFMQQRLAGGCEYPLATKDVARLKRCIASYYTLITAIDEEIGRVLDYLESIGDLANTIVVYLVDHGDFAGEHGLFHKNLGIYESIHRVPLIISWPGGPQGKQVSSLVELVDVMPTLLELADVPRPGQVDGESLLPVMNGESSGKNEAICEWDDLVIDSRTYAIRTDRYRLVYYNREVGGELYDHTNDPGEIDNLWGNAEYREVQTELMARLLERVGQFQAKTDFAHDRELARRERLTPTALLQKRRRNWRQIAPFYSD